MKRLKLEIEELSITSFPTAAVPAQRGTVQAHAATTPTCPKTYNCTYEGPECVVTGGIDSCWCTEYYTCDCV
ncbi:MAG TPA: hypothetical protein VFT45_27770 [Longimicrobium sp.]|nr:hypothetical protein [Longimicrobium sp.]